MRTQRFGRVDIDESLLSSDMKRSADLPYSEHYSDFLCGRAWKSCMLWAPGGDAGDNVITHYDTDKPSSITKYGAQLPYVRQVMERVFALDRLVFARLAVMSESVGIPHRDYLELADTPAQERAARRFHVPLVTNDDCYFTEDNIIYRMRLGEVWLLDVTRVHSSAVFSDIQRVHLLLDFKEVAEPKELLNIPSDSAPGIPEASICRRERVSDRERHDLLALAPVMDLDNLRDAFGIVIKKHYRKDGGDNFFWKTLGELAELRNDDAVSKRIRQLHKYYTMERSV